MISPKIESENLKKLVEEFLKNSEESENPEEESEGLDSTDRIVNTFKSMLNSIKEIWTTKWLGFRQKNTFKKPIQGYFDFGLQYQGLTTKIYWIKG